MHCLYCKFVQLLSNYFTTLICITSAKLTSINACASLCKLNDARYTRVTIALMRDDVKLTQSWDDESPVVVAASCNAPPVSETSVAAVD